MANYGCIGRERYTGGKYGCTLSVVKGEVCIMYEFADRDLGMDCNFEVTRKTFEEVKAKALEHAKEMHADMFNSITPEEMAEMDKQLEKAIREI